MTLRVVRRGTSRDTDGRRTAPPYASPLLKADINAALALFQGLLLPPRSDLGKANLFISLNVALDHIDPLPGHRAGTVIPGRSAERCYGVLVALEVIEAHAERYLGMVGTFETADVQPFPRRLHTFLVFTQVEVRVGQSQVQLAVPVQPGSLLQGRNCFL